MLRTLGYTFTSPKKETELPEINFCIFLEQEVKHDERHPLSV